MPPLLTADAPGIGFSAGPGQWGIFAQSGQPLLAVDSVDSIEYARDYRVSDYPQEQGAFQSYNKVQTPFLAKVGFLIAATRTDFLNAIEAACASLQLVAVVTPEISYPSANLTHYGYRRDGQSGKTMIRVDVWCEEIRFSGGSASGNNTQSTNASQPTQSGNVQPAGPATQNAPAPSGPDYGGGGPDSFPDAGGNFLVPSTNGSLNLNSILGAQAGEGGLPITFSGIPNATGGGAGSQNTDLNDVLTPVPFGM